jgi:hypothetical protein
VTPPKIRPATPAITLAGAEAAGALGVGATLFKSEIAPNLRAIRVKGKVLYPVAELERWATENAQPVLTERIAA